MKKEKKNLKFMSDDELVDLGVKYNKGCNISKAVKWIGFGVLCLGTFIAPINIAQIFVLSNFAFVNIAGTIQVVFASKRNECAKVLESRGVRNKLSEKIEKQIEEPETTRRVTKEEIKECGDVFPEFATNYRITAYDNDSQNER